MAEKKIGVVLMNLGGPDSLEAVEPFLYNLFSDPDIINFPLSFLFRKRLAKLISVKRSPRIKEQYEKIGGRSPINELTFRQAELLELKLAESFECRVYTAMRYWHPFTREVLRQIGSDGIEQIVLLPLYPHYSIATTGSSLNEWKRQVKEFPQLSAGVRSIKNYHIHPAYIDSLIDKINSTIKKFPEAKRHEVHILFSAHGTPVKLVKNGDPYSIQILETVAAVMERGKFKNSFDLCYQSKVGPQRWLEPSTPGTIEKLASRGVKYMLIVPVAFVSDHLETLFELGIEYRHLAIEKGVEQYEVMPGLNDSPVFISALADIVKESLSQDL